MTGAPFDLYQLRCAIAALVTCVEAAGCSDDLSLRRVDVAVGTIKHARGATGGRAMHAAIDRLLRPAADADGVRTVEAIGELGRLASIERHSAPALAAALRVEAPATQGRLFELGPASPPVTVSML